MYNDILQRSGHNLIGIERKMNQPSDKTLCNNAKQNGKCSDKPTADWNHREILANEKLRH